MANIYYNSGNVGIGTATVSYPLHVQGQIYSSSQFILNSSVDSGLWFGNGNAALGRAGGTGSYSSSAVAGDIILRSAAANKLLLQSGEGASAIAITSTGNVGIGTNNPKHMLHVSGILQVGDGTDATPITMQTGSLIIGSGTRNYGGSTTSWNTNTAGLVMECSENTEIVVHDSMTSLHSFMRYTTNGNFTIGRNMGHGVASVFKGNNGTAWDQTSDHRIKENVKKANLAICYDNVKNINLYRFNYTKAFGNDTHKDRTQLGFIAQQVNLYYPKSITRGKRKLDDNKDVPDLASIDITQVNFTLFGAVKQLIRVVEKQSNRIKRLEEILNIVADDDVENDADEPYVKIVCEGEVDIDSIVPSEPEEKISSSNTSNVF